MTTRQRIFGAFAAGLKQLVLAGVAYGIFSAGTLALLAYALKGF